MRELQGFHKETDEIKIHPKGKKAKEIQPEQVIMTDGEYRYILRVNKNGGVYLKQLDKEGTKDLHFKISSTGGVFLAEAPTPVQFRDKIVIEGDDGMYYEIKKNSVNGLYAEKLED